MPDHSNGIDTILQQIKKSLDAGLFYPALALCLSLPEICSRMEQEDIISGGSKNHYIRWFDEYLGPKYDGLSGEDCYYLRCGIAHNAKASHRNIKYSRVIFSFHPTSMVHNCILHDVLCLDCTTFCDDMICAVREWQKLNSDNATVKGHLASLITLRENGLSPYVVGIPIIA